MQHWRGERSRKASVTAPIVSIVQELVRFDMQKMANPEISGIEYQQGTLAGYEIREYLLEKWQRECAYCGVNDVPLQVEHIHPKAKGGSNRISNLAYAYGFPRGYLTREKRINGFQTGDMVIATVTKGKKTGIHKGRVAVRASGNFNIQTAQGIVQGIAYKYCQLIQRSDGYAYA